MKLSPIMVWRWLDAPNEYKQLSAHGGDEDWIAYIRKDYIDELWVEDAMSEDGRATSFGCCDVQIVKLENGDEIRIGAHA